MAEKNRLIIKGFGRTSQYSPQVNLIFEKYESHAKKWKNELKGNCFDLSFDDKIIDLDFFEALSPSGDKLNLFETAKTNIQVKPHEYPVAKYLHLHLLGNLDKEREVKPIFINKEQSITEQLQQKIPDINKYVFTLKLYKESEIKDLASESLANELKKIMDTKKDVSYPALVKYSLKEPSSANSIGCVSEEKMLASLKNCMTTLFEDVLSKKTEEMKKQLKEEIKQSIDASLSDIKNELKSLIGNETKSMESKINIKLSENKTEIIQSIDTSLSNMKNELKSSLGNENKSLENRINIQLSENKTEFEKSLDTSLSNIKNELKSSLCNDIKSMESRMNIQLSESATKIQESVDTSLLKSQTHSQKHYDYTNTYEKPIIDRMLSGSQEDIKKSANTSLFLEKNKLQASDGSTEIITKSVKPDEEKEIYVKPEKTNSSSISPNNRSHISKQSSSHNQDSPASGRNSTHSLVKQHPQEKSPNVGADQKSQSQIPEPHISQPDPGFSLFPESHDIELKEHDFIKKFKLTILKEELTIDFIFTCDSSDDQSETVYILKEDCSDLNDSINAVTLNIPKGKQDICQSLEISEECLSAGFKIIFGNLPNKEIIIENGTCRFSYTS